MNLKTKLAPRARQNLFFVSFYGISHSLFDVIPHTLKFYFAYSLDKVVYSTLEKKGSQIFIADPLPIKYMGPRSCLGLCSNVGLFSM